MINLVGIPIEHRPAFSDGLLPRLQELRARTGRPHWIVVDETHHLMPTTWHPTAMTLPQRLEGMILITVHPDERGQGAVERGRPGAGRRRVARTDDPGLLRGGRRTAPGDGPDDPRAAGGPRLVAALAGAAGPGPLHPPAVGATPPLAEVRRGQPRPRRSFHFRGPEEKLNLRAQNLNLFLQIADGVDDETWMHHLRQGDYSEWFRSKIKDADLAGEAERVEKQADVTPQDSRAAIREAVERRYTLPSEPAEYAKADEEEEAAPARK